MLVYSAIFQNGKNYIGATSQSLEKRKKDHINAMKNVDNKFYRALNKYGVENVEFREIRKFETAEQMFLAEKILIHRHKTQKEGYNSTSGGEGTPGREITEEDRKRISEGQKKRFSNPEEIKKTSDATIKWREDNPEASKIIEEKRLASIKTNEFRHKQSEKMKQVYKDKPEIIKNMQASLIKNYKDDPELAIKISRSLGGKPINVYKDNTYITTFNTLSECSRTLNLSIGNIGMVMDGKRNHTGGYVFKRKTE